MEQRVYSGVIPKHMLADGLTKHMDTSDLRSVMSGSSISMDFMFHAKNDRGVKTSGHSAVNMSTKDNIGPGMET